MTSLLHLLTDGGEIHLDLGEQGQSAADVLDLCIEGMKGARVVVFADTLPPGGVHRAPLAVNFARVSAAWVEADAHGATREEVRVNRPGGQS
jgi:hypothetical protein